MKIFISWSKEPSKTIAQVLASWLPEVIQSLKPWVSTDISAGNKWNNAIALQLEQAKFGIICVTPDNRNEPWLQFEAGALAKTLNNHTYVCPYLINFGDASIEKNPLTAFQYVKADYDGTWDLIKSINKALSDNNIDPLTDFILKKSFDKAWPDLLEKIKEVKGQSTEVIEAPQSVSEKMLSEILEISRQLSRASFNQNSLWGETMRTFNKRKQLNETQVDPSRILIGTLDIIGPSQRVFTAIEVIEFWVKGVDRDITVKKENVELHDNGDLGMQLSFGSADVPTFNLDKFQEILVESLAPLGLQVNYLLPD